ncbi:hypothetical protein MSAN_01067200 [Mycena sanguinolenta]|uniref:Sacsin/Nov domain-containing protein n=1 Tax=Mycena sanguinolenta TaxID=230812 RepID=A0A8H6YT13_9AGAR|nr:hypothetical protein MSAN_01067200 [Mycena sanguinolenta]
MPENFRERADLTKIIKSILDSYPLGNGILRELLQNSDDASATTQTFILDLRTHPSSSLVDEDLVECQGPALLAINDTLFSDPDWKAISTLHGSSKTADENKIGKFGIGVRSCYHLTDNPHFLSGRKLVIFDPHERFSSSPGGVRMDIIAEGSMYRDQLSAFDRSLSPDATGFYDGTVVRLPLRTIGQAAKSTIKPTAVNPSDIETLFDDFVERELSVVMLFLKHIRHICLKVISANGQERFVGSAKIPVAEKHAFSRTTGAQQRDFECTISVTLPNATTPIRQVWRILHAVRSTDETSRVISRQLGYDVGSKLADDKLFSHVALAFPVQPSVSKLDGRLFTLLPLPIHTKFPVHLHAILALTQDRQSLRNIEEIGTGSESRERLLVTWNRAIFDEFLPTTWAALLHTLVKQNEIVDIWSAWPTDVMNEYWRLILPNLMKRVLDLDLPVFPVFLNANVHVSLSSAFLCSESDDVAVLEALAKVGLVIVKIPQHLHNALPFAINSLWLDPKRASDALKSRISRLVAATEKDKDHILRYLVLAPGSVALVKELPLVPLVNGSRISLSDPSQKYVLVTKAESKIFGDSDCNGSLISLSDMPSDVAAVFCAASMPNVARLNRIHVQNYINTIFGAFNPADDEITSDEALSKVEWLTRFWSWMSESTWEDKRGLLQLVNHFHLLPTTRGTLRKMKSRVLLPISGPNAKITMTAWHILGIGFLHHTVVPYASAFQSFTVAANDIPFLISSISSQNISSLDSDPQSALLIQEHLLDSMGAGPFQLDSRNHHTFLQLPIFPTRVAISDPRGGRKSSRRQVGAASGTLIYMRVDDSCPVPIVRDQNTFFDVLPRSGALGTLINPTGMKKALDELGVLEMAIDQLAAQPEPVLDALLTRIIHRLSDLSESARRKLQDVPFVPVFGQTNRIPPSQVIDPRSKLASLYEGEPGKLPGGRCGTEPYLSLLISHGFFKREMTGEIVTERITYLATQWPAADYPRIFDKARKFLVLLDESWPNIQPALSITWNLAKPWMPIRKDSSLATPLTSRDKEGRPFLFDLVLFPVDGRIHNTALRRFLGWDSIATHILHDQLQRALNHTRHRPIRLHTLITEFSRRALSDKELESLKDIVSNRPWIPIRDEPPEIAETRHALLVSPIEPSWAI